MALLVAGLTLACWFKETGKVYFVEAGGGRLALISVVKVIEPAFVKGEKVIFS